jgi:hypothetical protein
MPEAKPIGDQAAFVAPFQIPGAFAARKTETRNVDFNADGYSDVILTVYRSDSAKATKGAGVSAGAKTGAEAAKSTNRAEAVNRLVRGFETLLLYAYQPAEKSYKQVFSGKFFYGVSVNVQSLTKNTTPEIVIKTDGGGNSALASQGMTVLAAQNEKDSKDGKSNKYVAVTELDEGSPRLVVTGADSTWSVVTHTRFAPDFAAKSDATECVDSVVVLADTEAKRQMVRRNILQEYLARAAAQYKQAKSTLAQRPRDPQTLTLLYATAAAQIMYMLKLGEVPALKTFRTNEANYWRGTLSAEAVTALQEIRTSYAVEQ